MSKSFEVSAPGSLMLFGEHAVLRGKMALVCAIDRRITISLTPRRDDVLVLESETYHHQKLHLDDLIAENLLCSHPDWRFVLASIIACLPKIKSGFNLQIRSNFPSLPVGLGSSAAVTVACCAVLNFWLNKFPLANLRLLRLAKKVISRVQGACSGADAAASIFGGIIGYKIQPLLIEKLFERVPLTVIYSGNKVATAEVIAKVSASEAKHKEVFAGIFKAMNACTLQAKSAILHRDWRTLGKLMNIHQGLQDAIGVNDEQLAKIIFILRREAKIFGAKISGAGLGDCVIGLGETEYNFGAKKIAVDIAKKGVTYFKDKL